jgi:hypothetical protein
MKIITYKSKLQRVQPSYALPIFGRNTSDRFYLAWPTLNPALQAWNRGPEVGAFMPHSLWLKLGTCGESASAPMRYKQVP